MGRAPDQQGRPRRRQPQAHQQALLLRGDVVVIRTIGSPGHMHAGPAASVLQGKRKSPLEAGLVILQQRQQHPSHHGWPTLVARRTAAADQIMKMGTTVRESSDGGISVCGCPILTRGTRRWRTRRQYIHRLVVVEGPSPLLVVLQGGKERKRGPGGGGRLLESHRESGKAHRDPSERARRVFSGAQVLGGPLMPVIVLPHSPSSVARPGGHGSRWSYKPEVGIF